MPTIDIVLHALGAASVNQALSGVANALGDVQNHLVGTSQASVDAGKRLQEALDKAKVAADNCAKSIKNTGVSVDDLRKRMADTGMTLKDTVKSFGLTGNAAEQAANAYRKAGKDGTEAAREVAQAQREVQAELQKTQDGLNKLDQGLHMARNAGLGMMAVGSAFEYAAAKGVENAASMETQIKTLEALTGSAEKARAIFKEVDDYSVKSIAELPDLISAAKNLQAAGIYNPRNLRAADDLAAQGRDRGVTAPEIAFALSRLKNGDFGRGFERARELGVGRQDMEAEGLKFNSSGEYQDKTAEGAQRAVDGLVRAIEKKFGGLSEKLGAETTEGALSNLHDAFGRVSRSIFDELLPTITVATRFLTGVAGVFNEIPSPIRKIIAFGTVLIGALLILGGGLIVLVSTAGIAFIAMSALGISVGAAGVTAGGATISFGALAVGLGVAALGAGLLAIGFVLAVVVVIGAIYGLYKAAQWLGEKLGKMFGEWETGHDPSKDEAQNHQAYDLGVKGGTIKNMTYEQWIGQEAHTEADDAGDGNPSFNPATALSDVKQQLDALKNNSNTGPGIAGVADTMVGASGVGASGVGASGVGASGVGASGVGQQAGGTPDVQSSTQIEALADKIAATDNKEERKQLREELRLARRASKHEKVDEREEKHDQRETQKVQDLASRENATSLTEAARVQAAERKEATKEEIERLQSSRKAERRADEDTQERINRSYELSHTRARGLDLEHMQGIVALQKAGFSLSQIGAARDVFSALKKVNAGRPLTEEERLRETWGKEDRDRAFRRDQEDKDEALRHHEEGLRESGTADAGMMLAQAKSQGGWGKNARMVKMRAQADEQIARIKANHAEDENGIEYSNSENISQRVALPKPRTRRNLDGTITIYQAAWEHQVPLSRSDRDARAY